MALELKTALEVAGLPTEIDSEESLKQEIDKRFIVRDEAIKDTDLEKRFYGKFATQHESALQKSFGLTPAEIAGMSLKDIIKLSSEKTNAKIKDLEESNGKGADEKVVKLQQAHDKLKSQLEEIQGVNAKLIQEKDQLTAEFDGKLKNIRIEEKYKEAKGKLAFAEGIPDAAKVGFDTIFKGKYKINLDDNGSPSVTDMNDKPIPNPKRTGVYLGLEEVMDNELEAQGMKSKNNLPAGPAKKPEAAPEQKKNVREVHPNALAHAERLKTGQ